MFTIKSIFYKFCFCLGLGTASYYAYAQVQSWVKGDDVASRTSVLQDKVHDLTQNELIGSARHMAHMNRAIKAPVVSAIQSPAAPESSPAALAEASPSPSPAEGEKKEGEENKTAENAEGVSNPEALPFAQSMPGYAPNSYADRSLSSQSDSSVSTAGSQPSHPDLGIIGGGYLGGVAGSGQNGGYSGNTGSNSGASSVLTQQDVAALTAPVEAAFSNQQNQVNGYSCTQVAQSSCTYQNGMNVHSLRWNLDEGLRPNVNFAVRAASGSTPVQFDVSFKIQDRLLNDQTVTLNAHPTEVFVHNEIRESKNYRVFEFRMPDTEVRSEDTLTRMEATLVYEVTDTGLVMSPDSKFSFARDQVRTSGASWDPSGNGSEMTQNEMYFIADELPYSMSLQKSQ